MRRDVFISNDSGGLSVVAADAVPAIIEDGREDDRAFAAKHQAILLSLHGDDSPIVRIVVDEPLTPDEDAQWLARVRRKLVTPAGRIAVAGGFDPDVFADWQDAGAPAVEKDDRVVAVAVPAGAWIVDVYTHVDSMNGGELLDQRSARHGGIGGWFRAGHPGRAWPLWLARRLWGDGERDPGHEALWSTPLESIRAGDLKVATRPIGFVGFLVHLTRPAGTVSLTRLPGDGWFDTRTGSRRLATLPLGLSSKITRRGQPLADEIAAGLRKAGPRASRKPRLASASTPVLDTWTGGPLQRFRGKPVEVPLDYLAIVYLLALMATDGSPALDVKVTNSSGWFLPPSGAGYVITGGGSKFRGGTRVGVTGAEALDGVDGLMVMLSSLRTGTVLELATEVPGRPEGRLRFIGEIANGIWRISEANPAIAAGRLHAALLFALEAWVLKIEVQGRAERAIVQAAIAAVQAEAAVEWKGRTVLIGGCKPYTRCRIAASLFRTRFADLWPMAGA